MRRRRSLGRRWAWKTGSPPVRWARRSVARRSELGGRGGRRWRRPGRVSATTVSSAISARRSRPLSSVHSPKSVAQPLLHAGRGTRQAASSSSASPSSGPRRRRPSGGDQLHHLWRHEHRHGGRAECPVGAEQLGSHPVERPRARRATDEGGTRASQWGLAVVGGSGRGQRSGEPSGPSGVAPTPASRSRTASAAAPRLGQVDGGARRPGRWARAQPPPTRWSRPRARTRLEVFPVLHDRPQGAVRRRCRVEVTQARRGQHRHPVDGLGHAGGFWRSSPAAVDGGGDLLGQGGRRRRPAGG